MELVLDFVCIAVLILFCVGHRKHALFSSGSAVISYALALAVAVFVSAPLGAVVDEQLVSAPIQSSAAGDIADMYSVQHQDSPVNTLKAVPMEELLEECSAPFVAWVETYRQDVDTLHSAYQAGGEQAFLDTLTGGMSFALSRAAVFAVLFVLFALVFRLISKRIESNLPLRTKRSGWHRLISMIFGLLVGFVMVQAAVLVLSWIVPYGAGAVLFLDEEAWQRSIVYQFSPLLMLV